ncbi:MAG: hypothetical protein CL565_00080 [Alphaproteobacteria bacterium]|nr:hypothetical protein [Alphaproteobacteria bacterium]|tara:strand:- start:520 stop:1917 length:1398 start_codon:yes stop_codon:yes gene_type:complete
MLFVEPRFFLFFAVVFAIYWVLKGNMARKILLLLASYGFYAAWDWRFLSLILISTIIDYCVARKIEATNEQSTRKHWLWLSLASNLGILGFFKYFNFFTDSAVELMTSLGMTVNYTTLSIVLPVGISFYTFQTLSYTIDVYRKNINAEKNILDVAVFVAFFPQLVAGPIVRAADFLPQLTKRREWREVAVKTCILLFLVGFIKKACVSDNIAYYVDLIFATPGQYSPFALAMGVCLYAIQIYCDFSGYTDMAIAVAGLLGFHLPKNFAAPYLARNLVDFWRRWHISLSTWLRDYLYIPLGGNRNGTIMRYRNLMLTMLLGGLWHGAAWTFVFWGFLHGAGLSFNHALKEKISSFKGFPSAVSITLTFAFVNLAWIYFRAPDFETALLLTGSLLTWSSEGAAQLPIFATLAFPFLGIIHILWQKYESFDKVIALKDTYFYLGIGIATAIALGLQPTGYKPFIYFQF